MEMSVQMKTFHPIKSTFVDASAPHPANTQYRISVGNEFFESVPKTVVVVQMVYNGKVEGRKSPAFPADSDDFFRVSQAANELIDSLEQGRNQ